MQRYLAVGIAVSLAMAATSAGQMEKRLRVLYDRKKFRSHEPAVGASLPKLVLRDLEGANVQLAKVCAKRRVVIIGGAYT